MSNKIGFIGLGIMGSRMAAKLHEAGFDLEPESIEAQVVHDADLIEKTGWIGVLQG